MKWTACQFEVTFPRPVMIMGIVNATPDSFSDGGQFLDADRAVAHGLEQVDEGAELIDVGGESTRPGATAVSEEEELRRVLPVVRRLAQETRVPISIDTMKPAVAQAALDAGASIVNDVAANRGNDRMWRVVAATGAGYICMHMRGTPETMQTTSDCQNVVQEMMDFFHERLERITAAGVNPDQIALDVGIGFGKTTDDNLKLIGALQRFTSLERPLMLGVSRKSFIGKVLGVEVAERLPASLACGCLSVGAGVSILRVHDVAETVQAVRMTEAILQQAND